MTSTHGGLIPGAQALQTVHCAAAKRVFLSILECVKHKIQTFQQLIGSIWINCDENARQVVQKCPNRSKDWLLSQRRGSVTVSDVQGW